MDEVYAFRYSKRFEIITTYNAKRTDSRNRQLVVFRSLRFKALFGLRPRYTFPTKCMYVKCR